MHERLTHAPRQWHARGFWHRWSARVNVVAISACHCAVLHVISLGNGTKAKGGRTPHCSRPPTAPRSMVSRACAESLGEVDWPVIASSQWCISMAVTACLH